MIDIPPFNKTSEQDIYLSIFEEKLTTYCTLMDKVKDALYGPGFGNYTNLPGSSFQVLEKITSDLINVTSNEYALTTRNTLNNYTLGDK